MHPPNSRPVHEACVPDSPAEPDRAGGPERNLHLLRQRHPGVQGESEECQYFKKVSKACQYYCTIIINYAGVASLTMM